MSEIVAAMIIACSNLISGSSMGGSSLHEYAQEKAQCIQRINQCALKSLSTKKNELPLYEIEIMKRVFSNCEKEVHL